MRARRAKISDAAAIFRLIDNYARQGLLLPRAEGDVRRSIGNFVVLHEKGKLLSCVALENYGADLAEIRSLAVDPEIRGRRIWLKDCYGGACGSAAAGHCAGLRCHSRAGFFPSPGI